MILKQNICRPYNISQYAVECSYVFHVAKCKCTLQTYVPEADATKLSIEQPALDPCYIICSHEYILICEPLNILCLHYNYL